MLTPAQVAEQYFLESRHQLLEVAAMLDRHDAAVARSGTTNGSAAADRRIELVRRALAVLAEPRPPRDRTVALLELFATS